MAWEDTICEGGMVKILARELRDPEQSEGDAAKPGLSGWTIAAGDERPGGERRRLRHSCGTTDRASVPTQRQRRGHRDRRPRVASARGRADTKAGVARLRKSGDRRKETSTTPPDRLPGEGESSRPQSGRRVAAYVVGFGFRPAAAGG